MSAVHRLVTLVRAWSALPEDPGRQARGAVLAQRTLLVRALSRAGLLGLAHRGELAAPGRRICFFGGASWRLPRPEDAPLAGAIAFGPGVENVSAPIAAWPGDVGGLTRYCGLSPDEASAWQTSWRLEGMAWRDYLATLLGHAFGDASDFLRGDRCPAVNPAGQPPATPEERGLARTLRSSHGNGRADPSGYTPEVRMEPRQTGRTPTLTDVRSYVRKVAVFVPEFLSEASRLRRDFSDGVQSLASQRPVRSLRDVRERACEQSRRATALARWSLQHQEDAWRA